MRVAAKLRLLFLVLVIALGNAPGWAQGCAMCNANAKATPQEAQRSLNRAILVMLAPPVGIMVFGFAFAIRYGKRRDRENDSNSD